MLLQSREKLGSAPFPCHSSVPAQHHQLSLQPPCLQLTQLANQPLLFAVRGTHDGTSKSGHHQTRARLPSTHCHSDAMEPRQLVTHTLRLPADVAEWCPTPGATDVLAVGMYKLDEATQLRHGAVHLFQLQPGSNDSTSARSSMPPDGTAADPAAGASTAARLVQCTAPRDVPGVFDLRWHPRSAMPRLAAALADGTVHVLELGEPADGLRAVAAAPGGDAEGMAVSLDFSRCAGTAGDQLAASYSSGQLQLFQVKRRLGRAAGGRACRRAWRRAGQPEQPSQPLPAHGNRKLAAL